MKHTKFTRILSLAVCAGMLAAATIGCGGKASTGDAASGGANSAGSTAGGSGQYKKEIIIGNATDVTTTDPQASNTQTNITMFIMTHNTLLDKNRETGEIINDLAESYEQVSDTEFEFKIHEGVKFHDGSDCKASDVKFTLERAKNSSFTSGKVESIESIEVADDYTLRIKLNSPSQDFLVYLSDPTLSILSEAAMQSGGDEASKIGTGPYKFDSWVPGDAISVVRNDDYWGEKGKTEKITFRLIGEDSARVIALQTGEIDVCMFPPTMELSHIADDKNLELIQIEGNRMVYLAFNTQKTPFDKKEVRQALAHAINKDDIVSVAINGLGTVAKTVFNVGTFGYYDGMEGFDFNPDKAKELLTAAGYPDGFTMEVTVTGADRNTIAQLIQANFAKIGVTVNINNMESAAQKALLNEGGHQAVVYAWSNENGPDYSVRSLFYTGSGSNRMMYSNKQVDEMIDKALVEGDSDKRLAMYKELQEFLVDDCPMVPLYTETMNLGKSAKLQGIVLSAAGDHDFSYIYVEE